MRVTYSVSLTVPECTRVFPKDILFNRYFHGGKMKRLSISRFRHGIASSRFFPMHCRKLHSFDYKYDVIIVGGGHAGLEACCAASRMGVKSLLITHKKESIGEMSCNPSFGGIGKGHLMKEVDALDGVCARICDLSGIHYKLLNSSNGPAVWGPRAQIDRKLYKEKIQEELFQTPNLDIIYTSVDDLLIDHENTTCVGVVTKSGDNIYSKTVILTTGTFLNGQINIGLDCKPAGRVGDEPSIPLAQTLEKLNFKLGRLKTGTPPRLRKQTINFEVCQRHKADDPPRPFSFLNKKVWIKPENQVPCYLTFTNENVKKIILDNMHLNKHVKEEITGPRYCPSIESKYLRFSKKQHHIWLEPEGLDSDIIYPGGLSCTLPADLQVKMVREIKGLENAEVVQHGYGVEYDYVDPRELNPNLETIKIPNLFFAGQINGTTGYEEAAAQGIIAGINAAAKCQKKPEFIVSRSEGYVGVLIDDLTTLGTSEPYRMFTARAEFRLYLRPDNADLRLTKKGFEIGCVSRERYNKTMEVSEKLDEFIHLLKEEKKPARVWRQILNMKNSSNMELKSALHMLAISRCFVDLDQIRKCENTSFKYLPNDQLFYERLLAEALYADALKQEMLEIEEIRRQESIRIPDTINYEDKSFNLSSEEKVKLTASRPQTIAAASRIPGVTPCAILQLLKYAKRA